MKRRQLYLIGTLAMLAILIQGCGGAFMGMGKGSQRATNVEIHLVSQSCFQGEIVPCG